MNVLVSGSFRGLGRQIANSLAAEGYDIWRHSRIKPKGPKQDANRSLYGELSDPKACKDIADHLSECNTLLDGLICNAGSGKSVQMGMETVNDWQKSFDDNFYSAVNLIQALEQVALKPGAKIIVIGSICGSNYIQGAPLTYSCAKGALEIFVNNYAAHLSKRKIQITYLELGNMLFEGSSWETKLKENSTSVVQMMKEKIPLEKFGTVKDIVGFIDWFLDNENTFSTGSKYTIDGGQTI